MFLSCYSWGQQPAAFSHITISSCLLSLLVLFPSRLPQLQYSLLVRSTATVNRHIGRIWWRRIIFPALLSSDTFRPLYYFMCALQKAFLLPRSHSLIPNCFFSCVPSIQYDIKQPGKVHLMAVTREAEGR